MARPRKAKARAKRRIAQRTARNSAAKQATPQKDKPRLEYARQKQYLEVLRDRGRKTNDDEGITERQYESGDRLYRDWRASGGEPRLVPGYGGFMARSVNGGYAEYQVAARFRFERVLATLNMLHRTVVIHSCLLDLPLSGWCVMAPSKGIVCLRKALDLVADAYDRPPKREYVDIAKCEVVESW